MTAYPTVKCPRCGDEQPDYDGFGGPFDLDPCAPRVRPWEMAAQHYTIDDDGLANGWRNHEALRKAKLGQVVIDA